MTEKEIKVANDLLNYHYSYVYSSWKAICKEIRETEADTKTRKILLEDVSKEKALGFSLAVFAKSHLEEFISFCNSSPQNKKLWKLE